MATGETIAWGRLEGIVRESPDAAVQADMRAPNAIGFNTGEIARTINIEEWRHTAHQWHRAKTAALCTKGA